MLFWVNRPAASGATYYVSPTGNDGNAGSSGAPWLSCNHTVNAGDTIIALPGTYSANNFIAGKWGTVNNIPSADGQYMARLVATSPLGSCTITNANDCIRPDKSGWAVIGWVVETTADNGAALCCTPSSAANIKYIAFINNVVKGSYRNGISLFSYPGDQHFGVDYFAAIGNAIYDSAKGSVYCNSGISIYQPVLATDIGVGAHIYVAGNIIWNNLSPQGGGCAGGQNTDGNGIILDDWAHSQHGTPTPYAGTAVIENNMIIGNGWAGLSSFINSAATETIRYNTLWGNGRSVVNDEYYAGQILISTVTSTTTITNNISQTDRQTAGAGPDQYYACFVGLSNGNVSISGNVFFGVAGNNTQSDSSPGFSYGSNTLSTPSFAAAAVPGAPNPTTQNLVTELMATTIANFVSSAAPTKGYQAAGTGATDLYPAWLKFMVPTGLVTLPAGYERPSWP